MSLCDALLADPVPRDYNLPILHDHSFTKAPSGRSLGSTSVRYPRLQRSVEELCSAGSSGSGFQDTADSGCSAWKGQLFPPDPSHIAPAGKSSTTCLVSTKSLEPILSCYFLMLFFSISHELLLG